MSAEAAQDTREVAREVLQRVIDDLLFYSDEIETGRLPVRDAAAAVRVVAAFIALQRVMT